MREFLTKVIGVLVALVFVFCIEYSIGTLTNAWGATNAERASVFVDQAANEIGARCEKEMLEIGGWSLVKSCIELEAKALENLMRTTYNDQSAKPILNRCMKQMKAAFSWSIVESCVEMDLKAKKEIDAMRKG